ncbi:MAG: hypothetical protein WCF92_01815 [bacterium]
MEIKDIYTPIEDVGKIIRERFTNKDLRSKVEEKIGEDIPEILKNEPCGVIWRHIGTPDGEFERFLELCKKADLKPVCFEYTEDKFVTRNFTKYGLVSLAFSSGLNKNLENIIKREKIIDFKGVEGKNLRMFDIKTLWGENLVDFHHFFLQAMFPIMKNSVVDMSEFYKKRGKVTEFYPELINFSISHCVFFEDFDLLEEEDDFNNEVVLPSIKKNILDFHVKPIIVKISRVGEHKKDPYWWCYSEKAKEVMDNHIKKFK